MPALPELYQMLLESRATTAQAHIVEGDHAGLGTCLHKQRRALQEQHDGTDRLHSYAVTIPKVIPWPPIPPALPPYTARANAT